MAQGQPVIGRAQGVRAGMGNALPHQVGNKLKDVAPKPRYLPVLRFRDIPGEHMNFTFVFRKVGRNFFADEGLRQMGDFQRASNGVVICNRNVVHAPGSGYVVNLAGRGVTFAAADLLQNPLRGAG